MTRSAQPRVSWDEFVRLPDDDRRELVDGWLVERPVPTYAHERVVMVLAFHLEAWSRTHGKLKVLPSGYKVRISETRGVMPDIQVLSDEVAVRADPEALTKGRPELVVEVLSASNRSHDRVRKLGWYASVGVPEYWIVDPDARSFERLLLSEGRYAIADSAVDGVVTPDTFPGLCISLDELWAEVGAPTEPEG